MNIKLPDGSVRQYESGSTGYEIAKSISEGLARVALGIYVNDNPYDLSRPITEDANIKIVTFEQTEGKQMYWYSSAHLMAEALQAIFPGTKFGIGPAIENGFYYDVELPDGYKLTNEDLPKIEAKMIELAKKDSKF